MPEITLKSLTKLWNKEKEYYRNAEVGSGVQKFCKKVFNCDELFNLKEGFGSTNEINRSNEFLEETKKKGRMADVVIFIDSDIIVPVEVEKHGHIKAGETQLLNYQADWVKKYGILTDGNEWRFYHDKFIEKTFFIDKILDDPTDFLTFWKEYITPNNYYQSSFGKRKGQLDLSFVDEIPHVDDVRGDFFKDITRLIESFKNKLNLKGYFTDVKDDREREKKAVEITYAYLIQFILYKTLVDNGFADFRDDWEERVRAVRKALVSESYGEILVRIKGISELISENIYKRFSDEQEIINNHLNEVLSRPKNAITDVSVWLDILLFINRYSFINVKNEIFGYVYENYLKDLYLDEKKGQYFTDPLVVDFMLDQIGYDSKNLRKRYSIDEDSMSIIDPACGSGTFLYNATHRLVEAFFDDSEKSSLLVEHLINENIFGLDIAEFPLYLAEMNILMRMLPLVLNKKYNNPIDQKIKVFKTRDSISEFLDTAARDTFSEAVIPGKRHSGQMSIFDSVLDLGYESYMRDKRDLEELKSSLEPKGSLPRKRFDFVIGNPPYISFKECSKQNVLFFELQKSGKIRMSDIYGVNLHSVPNHEKKYAPNPNIYAYFIALGLSLLKDDGRFSFIIPQTLLTAGDLDVLRYHLSRYYTVEKIINFSGRMFIGRGIQQNRPVATSSLIFVVQKKNPPTENQVEIVNYEGNSETVEQIVNELRQNRNVRRYSVNQASLLKNFINWNFLLQQKEFIEFHDDYLENSESLVRYYEHKRSEELFGGRFYFDRGLKFPREETKTASGDFNIPLLLNNHFLTIRSSRFVEASDLVFPHGSQGMNVYRQKFKIVWRYINYDYFRFSDDDLMIDYNHVLISSNNRNEMIYLLSILNSTTSKAIFDGFLRNENEKDILIGIKSIKEFIRSPIVNETSINIKHEIISTTEVMLDVERRCVSDFADFGNVSQQKYDSVSVTGNKLVIKYERNRTELKIKGDLGLIESSLNAQGNSLIGENEFGYIAELKTFPIIDFKLQRNLKSYIDDLVFALYFKVKISTIGFENRGAIHKACKKHKYYAIINGESND